MDIKEYKDYNAKILDLAEEYFYNTSFEKICPSKGEEDLIRFWDQGAPDDKIEVDELIEMLNEGFIPGITGIINPRFWGYILTRPLPESHILDALVNATHAAPGATHLALSSTLIERCTFKWFLEEMGLKDFEGLYTNGGSMSILTALKCARDQVVSRNEGIKQKTLIFISEETHYSVARAWDILGGGIENVIRFSVNDLDKLSEDIDRERSLGNKIAAIVCNFGSTNSGEIEPIDKIVELANEKNIWAHIDASYGGPLLFVDKGETYRAVFQKTDSFNLDLHKWIGMPVGTSIVYLSTKYSFLQSFSFSQKFLDYQNKECVINDQCQMGIEGTRRLYGLRVWAAIRLTGFDTIRNRIERTLEVTEYLKKKLSLIEKIKVIENSDLSVVLFKIDGFDSKDLHTLAQRLFDDDVVFITVSDYEGQPVMRCCISNYETSEKDVDFVTESLLKYI